MHLKAVVVHTKAVVMHMKAVVRHMKAVVTLEFCLTSASANPAKFWASIEEGRKEAGSSSSNTFFLRGLKKKKKHVSMPLQFTIRQPLEQKPSMRIPIYGGAFICVANQVHVTADSL